MLLFYLLVAYGVCFGIQNKLPFLYSKDYLESGEAKRLRDRLLQCTYCTGFHCGWLTWLLVWGVEGKPAAEGLSIPFSIMAFAFASAAFSYVADAVVKWVEANTGEG